MATSVVGDEPLPCRRVGVGIWLVAVGGGGAELGDEFAACRVFADGQVEDGGDLIEAHRQSEVGRPNHRAPPRLQRQEPFGEQVGVVAVQPCREGDAFEDGVERSLGHGLVDECGEYRIGQLLAVGEVDDDGGAVVDL